jgi:hypothetical protein
VKTDKGAALEALIVAARRRGDEWPAIETRVLKFLGATIPISSGDRAVCDRVLVTEHADPPWMDRRDVVKMIMHERRWKNWDYANDHCTNKYPLCVAGGRRLFDAMTSKQKAKRLADLENLRRTFLSF